MDTPVLARGPQPLKIQLEAILKAHPGQGQDPGSGADGLDEPGLWIRCGPRRLARPSLGSRPVAFPEWHLAEPDAPCAERQPWPRIRGKLAQGRENFIPGPPGESLGQGHEAGGSGWTEADVLGLAPQQRSGFRPHPSRNALEV